MHNPRLTVVVAIVAALVAASTAGAGSTVKVCRLLSAKQVATISGLSPRCTDTKPQQGPGSTIYTGNWAGKTPRSPQLQVTVSVYTDKGLLQRAKHNLNQGLPGAAKKLKGIGSAAYAATGGFAAAIQFNVGKDIVNVVLSTVGKPPHVTPALKGLARAVAARL